MACMGFEWMNSWIVDVGYIIPCIAASNKVSCEIRRISVEISRHTALKNSRKFLSK